MLGKDINKAKSLLDSGEPVAIPTETVYGLAAKATDSDAVLKIFKAKERPFFDPLICHFKDFDQVKKWLDHIPAKAEVLAKHFWPGPLTLILAKSSQIPDIVTSGLDHMGVRIPRHPLTASLLEQLDYPIAAPSANPFGYVSPTTAQHVEDQLGERIPYILDGGECRIGLESTIVSFKNPERPRVLRYGAIGVHEIEDIIGEVDISLNKSSNPEAPGQLKKHYSPKTKVTLSKRDTDKVDSADADTAHLFYSKASAKGAPNAFYLSENGDLDEAARNLFRLLREIDDLGFKKIVAEEVPDEGIGKAINDRLRRAVSE